MPERRTQKVRFRKHCKDRSSLLSNDYSNDKKTEGKTISLSFSLSLDKHQTDTGGTGRAARHTMNDFFCLISLVLCVCLTFLFLLTATLLMSLRINITVKGFFVWFSFSSLRIMSKTDLCVCVCDDHRHCISRMTTVFLRFPNISVWECMYECGCFICVCIICVLYESVTGGGVWRVALVPTRPTAGNTFTELLLLFCVFFAVIVVVISVYLSCPLP